MRRNQIVLADSDKILVKEGAEKFIKYQIAKGNAADTIKYYETHIQAFLKFLSLRGIGFTNQITDETIQDYIFYIRENSPAIKDISINTKLRALRGMCYYLMDKGYMKSFTIHLLNAYKEPKDVYTEEEIGRLIKKPKITENNFAEYRNWVIVCHLLATGNRARTVRSIKIRNVDLKNRVIMLDTTKNKKCYEVPISKDYYPILVEYLQYRGGSGDDYLFCTYEGTQLSPDGLRTAIEGYCKDRKVEKCSLHLFRHLFAKTWILSGGSAKKLQSALGHETPVMVDEYLNIWGRELEEDFDINTPLAKMSSNMKKDKIKLTRKKS